MSDEEPFTSALGTFWVNGAPEQRMAGRLTVDGFPRLTVFNVGSRQTVSTKARQTILGVTNKGDYVSLFGTLGSRSLWNNKIGDDELQFPEVSFGASIDFTANTMVIGDHLHLDESKVVSITFTSAAVEHYFHLNASGMLDGLKFRNSKWDKDVTVPITSRKLRTVYVQEHKIKVRLFVNALPNESASPKARFQIDFRGGVSLDSAIQSMLEFRDLLSILCNEFIDIQKPTVLYRDEAISSKADLVFYNFRSNYDIKKRLAVPMVAIASSHELFYTVIRSWICERGRDKIARRAFVSTLLDEGVLKLSDVREIVTLLEMKAREKFKPILSPHFKKLRLKLLALIDDEIECLDHTDSQFEGLKLIRKKIDYLNSPNSKLAIQSLIEKIPLQFRSEIIQDPKAMASEIVDLRNDITHDLSRLSNRSYQIANKVIHILRWLYAVLDAMALGVTSLDFQAYYTFHSLAMRVDDTIWSRE